MIEVARAKETHKYLGASLPGDLRVRGKANLAHRLKCAWSKFHLFHASLTNKHVNIKLRLRLFDTGHASRVVWLDSLPTDATRY